MGRQARAGSHIRRRAWPALCVSGALIASAASPAAAQVPNHVADWARGTLGGGTNRTTSAPVTQPYFLLWSTPVTPAAGLLQTPYEAGGVAVDLRSGWVYAGTREGRVVCLERGRERWTVDVQGALLAAPTVYREFVVAATAEGVVHLLNKVTGERVLRVLLGEQVLTQPVVTEIDGVLTAFVGTVSDAVIAIDLSVGERKWRLQRDPPAGFTSFGFARPVLLGDSIFAGYANGLLVAADASTGEVRWEKRLSPPGLMLDVDAVATNGVHVFAASYTGGVYALDPATGDVVWRTTMPGVSRLSVRGDLVYAVTTGEVRALRVGDGQAVWSFSFDEPRIGTTPVVADRALVVAVQDGPLYFLDLRTGAPLGSFGSGDGFLVAPATHGNVLYSLSNGGRVYSLAVVK